MDLFDDKLNTTLLGEAGLDAIDRKNVRNNLATFNNLMTLIPKKVYTRAGRMNNKRVQMKGRKKRSARKSDIPPGFPINQFNHAAKAVWLLECAPSPSTLDIFLDYLYLDSLCKCDHGTPAEDSNCILSSIDDWRNMNFVQQNICVSCHAGYILDPHNKICLSEELESQPYDFMEDIYGFIE